MVSLTHDPPRRTHAHSTGADADQGPLVAALCLIALFIGGRGGGRRSSHGHSRCSPTPAHMLTDVAALGVSLVALRLAQRPPKGGLTFGLKRAEVLAALDQRRDPAGARGSAHLRGGAPLRDTAVGAGRRGDRDGRRGIVVNLAVTCAAVAREPPAASTSRRASGTSSRTSTR